MIDAGWQILMVIEKSIIAEAAASSKMQLYGVRYGANGKRCPDCESASLRAAGSAAIVKVADIVRRDVPDAPTIPPQSVER